MSPFHDLGRILRDVYEQHQRQPQPPAQDEQAVPRLVGGLWAAFGFEEAAAKYKQRLEEQYGFLHILGHHKPVPLAGVFTDVYLYDRPLALRRLGVAELEEQFRQRGSEQRGTQREDGLVLVRKERKLFILGQPGAGKTTFLKHIALQAAKGELPGVPVFVALKALADSELPLLDFMAQEMRICGFPEPVPFIQLMLQAGQLLILLDGLDEVTQAQEAALKLTQGIVNVIRQYSDNHFLITCRTAADYPFHGFISVEMADFSLEQVTMFIRKWFQHDLAIGEACLYELSKSHHKGLRDLARTPLLLNLLCLTYDERGHFPQQRLTLYQEALDALLVKWDNSRRIQRDGRYKQLDLGSKRQLLAYVAAATLGQGKYFVPKNEMVQYILDYLHTISENSRLTDDDGEVVLRAIEAQHGILVEWAVGVYGFAHLTFQEYFTARYVAQSEGKAWAQLYVHCTDPQWKEVFSLTGSLLSQFGKADTFFSQFCTHLDYLVGRDPQILTLLNWANDKVAKVDKSVQSLSLQRSLYIYLAIYRSFTHTFVRAFVHALARALTSEHERAHSLAIDLINMLSRDIAHTHTLSRIISLVYIFDTAQVFDLEYISTYVYAQTFALTQILAVVQSLDISHGREASYYPDGDDDVVVVGDIIDSFRFDNDIDSNSYTINYFRLLSSLEEVNICNRVLNSSVALDLALFYGGLYGRYGLAKPFIEFARKISREQALISLQRALEDLSVPDNNMPEDYHKDFVNMLWQIADQERQLQLFNLSEEQANKLSDYLQGTFLLIECLNLVTVKERDEIIARLLAPPPVA